jgi:competence protein ComGC
MYRMLGADQKEYGPVTAETLRQWIAEGRVTGNTMLLPEGGSQWVPAGSLPEFSGALRATMPPIGMQMQPMQPQKTSGLAIASLVLGGLGMCSAGLTGLVGLILGIVALVSINKSQGQLGGKGLAIAGISVSAVFTLLMVPMMMAIAIPNFVKARSTAQHNACINNLRQLDGATEQWALENKKTEKDTPTWKDLIGPDKYIKVTPMCPAGGNYTLKPAGDKPTCSVPGHELQ